MWARWTRRSAHAFSPSESRALYAAPGYVLFNRGDTVFAQAFDADSLKLSGEPVRVASGVTMLHRGRCLPAPATPAGRHSAYHRRECWPIGPVVAHRRQLRTRERSNARSSGSIAPASGPSRTGPLAGLPGVESVARRLARSRAPARGRRRRQLGGQPVSRRAGPHAAVHLRHHAGQRQPGLVARREPHRVRVAAGRASPVCT